MAENGTALSSAGHATSQTSKHQTGRPGIYLMGKNSNIKSNELPYTSWQIA